MALQRDARYPGRWTAASGGHPQGAFKNRTAPGSLDGSYIEQDWANDWDGFFGSLLTAASITANGTVDAVGASQYYSAFLLLTQKARTSMTAYMAAGTFSFVVPSGVTRIKTRAVGGGGGAGGSASGLSGGGGGGGGYAEGYYTVVPGATLTITVGAPGAGGTAGNIGSAGGTTSVSGQLSATGGGGGGAGGGGTGAGGFGGAGTGGQLNSVGGDGGDGTTTGAVGAGAGAGSVLGGSTRSGTNGRNSLSIGGGGSATYTLVLLPGGNGQPGAVFLEY